MSLVFYLRNFGTCLASSMVAMDVLAEPSISQAVVTATFQPDSDTKKLLISAVTSILSTLILKIYEDVKKRRRAKRNPEKTIKEG